MTDLGLNQEKSQKNVSHESEKDSIYTNKETKYEMYYKDNGEYWNRSTNVEDECEHSTDQLKHSVQTIDTAR